MPSPRAVAALVAMVLVGMMLTGAPITAHAEDPAFITNPADHVDTLIGTGPDEEADNINNFPGAAVPFGMVQYSPDTTDTYSGYDHNNERSTGFSMTHASVGCGAFGDIPMLPTTTPIGSQPWWAWEKIAHDDTEVGVPGYYKVRFPETGVTAELTATTRTGVGRFKYPDNGRPALFHVRSGGSLAGNSAATVQIGDDNATVTGSATTGKFCGKNNIYTVYFATKFNRPFTSYGTFDGKSVSPGSRSANAARGGGWVEFPAGSVLEARTALSYMSVDAARANLAAEGGASFDDVRTAASTEWDAALSRIAVAGSISGDVKTFYTSLYRTLLHPNTFNDADGRYVGFDGEVHTVAAGRTQYANFSDWDTYRSLAALQGLIFPERASDMAQSLVNDAEQSGSLPRWAVANSATGEMTGDNVVPFIVNLYAFGAKDFDLKKALYFMLKAATDGGAGRGGYVERPGIASYLEHGYAPQTEEFRGDHGIDGASITLEWSIDDFAIARFADALGDNAIGAEFQRRAQFWQNLFNPLTGHILPRGADGAVFYSIGFTGPTSDFGQDGFEEGNAEQYLWMVPHNIAGLVAALGGRQAVADRLDRFTAEVNAGPSEPRLWLGNEPGFGVPWLYNYIGQPWRAQETVDRARRELFGPTPGGEPGNDDLGALSSWYVWAALGLYPSTPGTSILTVNTPLFDRAEIRLPAGKSIRISAPGASNGLKYINGLAIDGQPTDQTFLPESIIHSGGDVAFSLSGAANTEWGTAESSAPPSFGAGSSASGR
jgi:predicted alpha-1,2-mannosidase